MTRLTREHLFWWSFVSDSEWWRVFLVDILTYPKSFYSSGYTCFEARDVLIDVGQPLREIAPTALHELLHVARGDASNEQFIRKVERPLLAIVGQFGFAIPPFPDGFEAMRRRALARRRRIEWEQSDALCSRRSGSSSSPTRTTHT